MKFKDPNTGRIFQNISVASNFFCSKQGECKNCPICDVDDDNDEWLTNNQREAAKLMGYEIIEEGDDKMEPKKSYLAEILGLEEDEVFRLEGRNIDFRIHNGNREMWSEYERKWTPSACESELANIINKRNKIVKVKRLTEHEKKICDDCSAKWVSRNNEEVWVRLWSEKPEFNEDGVHYKDLDWKKIIALADYKLFESVKPGDLIEVK